MAEFAKHSIAILILAGGRARRFPRKLEHRIDGAPMILRCYRNLRQAMWPTYIATNGSFPREIDAQLDAPLLIDRRAHRGPLHALVWACSAIDAERILAVAADQPSLQPCALQQLASSWREGDEAVVPEHDGRIEPLAALYARRAVLREGFELRNTTGAMHALVERLAARFISMDSTQFHNVNRPSDLLGWVASR
jgi:molybdopterin-guanine dinucleotide biosynthesis protein A